MAGRKDASAIRRQGIAGLLALLLATGVPPAQAQAQRVFRDWLATCDNQRDCRANALDVVAGEPAGQLWFDRRAIGRVEAIHIVLPEAQPRGGEWRLLADADMLLALPAAQLDCGEIGDADQCAAVVLDSPDEIDAVLAALRRASALRATRDGVEVARASLSGASAALLWIDEQQKRVGTADAFVRRGDRAPEPALVRPRAPQAERNAWRALAGDEAAAALAAARAAAGDSCEPLPPGFEGEESAFAHRDGRRMVALTCFVGPYNLGSDWYRSAGEGWAPLGFTFPAGFRDADVAPQHLVNAYFDPETAELSATSKGRGWGDCGWSARWLWTGAAFDLLDLHVMPECRGVQESHWPALWRAGPGDPPAPWRLRESARTASAASGPAAGSPGPAARSAPRP